MSRNNKSARLTAQRKQWSSARKSGSKGPARTEPKHGKRYSYRNPPPHVAKSRTEAVLKVLGKGKDQKSFYEKLKEKFPTQYIAPAVEDISDVNVIADDGMQQEAAAS